MLPRSSVIADFQVDQNAEVIAGPNAIDGFV
jgi:hypothetical protein